MYVLWAMTMRLHLSGDDPVLHRIDELYNGAAALELAAGRAGDLADLAWDPYSGGSLVVIVLARALFVLIGPHYIALKSIAIGFTGVTVWLWLLVARRLFGAGAAQTAGLLFVFAPLAYQYLGAMAWGNHAESAAPAVAAFYFLLRARDATTARAATAWASTSALLAALAPFFSWMGLLPLAAWIGAARASERAAPFRSRAALFAGVAVGALPFLWFATRRGAEAVAVLDSTLTPQLGLAPIKLWRLVTVHLPEFFGPRPWGALGAALAVAAIAQLVLSRTRYPRHAVIMVAGTPCAFAAAFAVTGFHLGDPANGVIAFHYLAPVAPYLLVAVAALLARLPSRPRLVMTAAVCAAFAGPVVARMYRLYHREAAATVLRYPGYSYSAYGWHLLESCRRDLACVADRIERIEPQPARAAARHGAAIGVGIDDRVAQWSTRADGRVARILALQRRAALTPTLADAIAERGALVWSTRPQAQVGTDDREQLLRSLGAELWPVAALPWVQAAFAQSEPDAEVLRLAWSLETGARRAALAGLGQALARRDRACPELAEADAAACANGLGFETTWQALTGGRKRKLRWTGDARAGAARALWLFEPDATRRRDDFARSLAVTGSAPTPP